MSKKKAPTNLTKREKFEDAGRFPVKKAAIIGVAVIVVVVGAFFGYRLATNTPEVGGAVVQQGGSDYSGGQVEMTVLPDATATGGDIAIPVSEITAKKIVGLVYHRTNALPDGYQDIAGNGLPLLAYVAPSGRLVVASALCEPCHSYLFHIEGNDLVCNSCFTHWDLNTLQGKSGGCQAYPPKELTTTVQSGTVNVPTDSLESWAPRA